MYQSLGQVTLRTGEVVEAGMIQGPDAEWATKLTKLLWHKGDPWNWQNAQCLERELPVDVFFHVLHRNGDPFANIMTIEYNGIGHFGHVWTEPNDRRKGASKALMARQMAYFQERGGRALFLGTGYDSVAYKIYQSFGFTSIELASGYMAYYAECFGDAPAGRAEAFTEAVFPTKSTEPIQPATLARFDWQDWVNATPLLLGSYRGMIRCAPWGMVGRHSPEGYLLPALLKEEKMAERSDGTTPRTIVLRHPTTEMVVGLAAWNEDPIWPETCLVDLYCHPDYWDEAPRLWQSLTFPEMDRVIAYVDDSDRYKIDFFMAQGFTPIATLPNFVDRTVSGTNRVDVTVLQQNGSLG